jgi:hypothetical protein
MIASAVVSLLAIGGVSEAQINVAGDMNLDSIDNSIADLAYYYSYFALGLGVFPPLSIEAVIAESDVNCDGSTLTVPDMVKMCQIMLGNAQPCTLNVASSRLLSSTVSRGMDANFTVSIEKWSQSVSDDFRVLVRLNQQAKEVNGYQFNIRWDPAGIELLDVVPGSPYLVDWQVVGYQEVFGGATRREVRIVGYPWESGSGTADLSNWSSAVLVELRFQITDPETSFSKPFQFRWGPCGDNSLAVLDWQGTAFETPEYLAVSSQVYDYDGSDITGQDGGGVHDFCLSSDTLAPRREIIFHNTLIEFEALCCETTGDYNSDGTTDLSDLIGFVNYLFLGGVPPVCPASVNINGDPGCAVDLTDLISLVSYLFTGGATPAPCMEQCM